MNGAFDLVARSDRGRVRARNEDSVAVDEALGLAALADGMGGLLDGHEASRAAVEAALEHLRAFDRAGRTAAGAESLVIAAVQAANRQVLAFAGDRAGSMGTTLEVLRLSPDGACQAAHVGDSRTYRLRGGALERLTRDHSMVQDMVERGLLRPEQARAALNRNVITRAVGLADAVEADGVAFDLAPGELVLLCSDGLWDMLDEPQIERLLGGCGPGRAGLDDCADRLVAAANAAGGADNISVVLARRTGAGPVPGVSL
ncbi:MAG: protein phosphatase 2C domain-containing protein [Pseudomonadales bacterium]